MNVYINSYKVDISVDTEQTLKEVIDSLSKWSRERDLIFTGFSLNGDYFSTENFPDKKREEIHELNCQIQSKADLILSTITEGSSYCDKVLLFIADVESENSADSDEVKNLTDGLEWFSDSIKLILGRLALDPAALKYLDRPVSDYLEQLAATINAIRNQKEDAQIKGVISLKGVVEILKAVLKMLLLSDSLKEIIIKGIESPDELVRNLKEIKETLSDQITLIEQASHAFQTGKDAEGAEKIQGFIEFIYKYLRCCHQVLPVFGIDPALIIVDSVSLEEMNKSIHGYFEAIIEVMENNDIISLSDILEYELSPQMAKIDAYINLLLEKIV